jgi:N-acetylglucosamine malate deacetylase 1
MLRLKVQLKEFRRSLVRKVIYSAAGSLAVSPTSALVIAPHPDDETLGCGGLIASKKSKGDRVAVVFLTDGEAAHRGCCNTTPDKIASARRMLADESGRLLGLKEKDMFWLGLSDGMIPRKDKPEFKMVVERISKLIGKIKPQEVYAPHYMDCWPDHEAASEIASAAISTMDYHCELYYYPVWMWHNLRLRLLPEILKTKIIRIDIGAVLERKKTAIDHYLSVLNTDCGKPYCGNLPEGFTNHFQYAYEIFFRAEKQC